MQHYHRVTVSIKQTNQPGDSLQGMDHFKLLDIDIVVDGELRVTIRDFMGTLDEGVKAADSAVLATGALEPSSMTRALELDDLCNHTGKPTIQEFCAVEGAQYNLTVQLAPTTPHPKYGKQSNVVQMIHNQHHLNQF